MFGPWWVQAKFAPVSRRTADAVRIQAVSSSTATSVNVSGALEPISDYQRQWTASNDCRRETYGTACPASGRPTS